MFLTSSLIEVRLKETAFLITLLIFSQDFQCLFVTVIVKVKSCIVIHKYYSNYLLAFSSEFTHDGVSNEVHSMQVFYVIDKCGLLFIWKNHAIISS